MVLLSPLAAASAESFQTFGDFDKYRQGCRDADNCEAKCHKEFESAKLKDGTPILACINECIQKK